MKIFLRQIPANASKADLWSAVQRAIAPRWYFPLRRTGAIHGCHVLKIVDRTNNRLEFHGIVDVEPEHAALSAILKLNGRKLLGKVVEAREWRERSVDRDRRQRMTQPSRLAFPERRRRERRRSDLHMEIL
jgi:hypothetical protein